MPRPALHLLGGPTLFDAAGLPISGGPAQRHRMALLAQLVIAAPNAISRDRLIGLLWPDRDAPSGRRLLNVAVTVLRQALGPGLIVTAGDDLRLDSSAIDADVHQFERALDEGRLEDAVASCRGAFLEGFFLDDAIEFERWVEAQRLRLARRYTNALTVLAERATRANEHGAAIGWWRALSHAEPTNPNVVLQLFEALVATGDVTGALAVSEVHAAYMRSEVGIEPDARLSARADALRASLVDMRHDLPLPRVVPVITPPEAAALRPSRGRFGKRHVLIAVSAVAVIAASTLGWRAVRTGRAAPDGNLVAVMLPVTHGAGVSAEDAEEFSELLALDLTQVDGVRILQASSAASPRPSGALTLLARLGADAGTFTATFRVVDSAGVPIGDATTTVAGGSTAIPALVDGASVRVLRLLWGRRWLVPEPRVAAISTTSIPALRSFLDGEQAFRLGHWNLAAAAYRAAAELDSTFALAWFRLGEADGWRTGIADNRTIDAELVHAERFASRLPPREASLLRFRRLFAAHDVQAVDTAIELAARYPGDPDAQFALADAWWHAGIIVTIPFEAFVRQWHVAIASDPVAVRPLLHAIDIARVLDAPALYDSVVALRRARGGDTISTRERMESFATWAPLARVRDTILAHARVDVRPSAGHPLFEYGLLTLIGRCVAGHDDCNDIDITIHDEILRVLGATARLVPSDRIPLIELTVDRGIMGSNAALIDAADIENLARHFVTLAAADPAAIDAGDLLARRIRSGADQSWRARMVVAELALAARDTGAARRELSDVSERLRGDTSTWGQWAGSYSPALARAAEGWFRIVAGDTAVGIRQMDAAIQATGFGSEAHQEGQLLSDELAIAMAAWTPTRDVGILRLRWITTVSDSHIPVLHLLLARALEAEGRGAEAATEYSRFSRLWRNADPPLRHLGEEATQRANVLEHSSP